jgi:hypothetical protein
MRFEPKGAEARLQSCKSMAVTSERQLHGILHDEEDSNLMREMTKFLSKMKSTWPQPSHRNESHAG